MHARKNKYRNKKIKYENYVFDSKFEFLRYKQLKLLERAKEIKNLEVHKKFLLQEEFVKNKNNIRKIEYESDFYYFDMQKKSYIIEDAKGFKTEVYKIKKKLLLKKYPDILFFENNKKKQKYY